MCRILAALVACAVIAPSAAAAGVPGAQEPATRAESLRAQRAAKAQTLEPHDPNPVEQAMYVAEERVMPLLQRDGIFARMGSLATGSGFAYGGGFRRRSLFEGRGSLAAWGAASVKKYWAAELESTYAVTAGREVVVRGRARAFARPSEEYFGIGPESRRGDRSSYGWDGTIVSADVVVSPVKRVRFGADVEHSRTETGRGDLDGAPSSDDLFDPAELAGFGETLRLTRIGGFVEVDYRQPLNARKGGHYRVDVSRVVDAGADAFSFTRTDVDLRQYVSFLNERRVLAGRVLVSTTDADAGSQVPFHLLPALGGNTTLRGFRANRFHGPHAVLLQGEYRFEIWAGLEGALFADAGKVALRRSDLDLRDLEHDVGFGFRFNTDDAVIVRIDAAFGSRDGRHLHVVFGGIF